MAVKQQLRPAPVERIEPWPIDKLLPYARNPKTHPADQVDKIAASMKAYGQTQLIVVDGDNGATRGEVIVGHGRVLAAEKLGWSQLMVGVALGWTKQEKQAYRLADNELGSEHIAPYDLRLLKLEYDALQLAGVDIMSLGFNQMRLTDLGLIADDGDGLDRGELLHRSHVVIEEPKHVVEHGDHYLIDKRHHLYCLNVITEWPIWSKSLVDGALFCPYPGVFVPFCDRAKQSPLVMVQPDSYIAGHILDRLVELRGKKIVAKL